MNPRAVRSVLALALVLALGSRLSAEVPKRVFDYSTSAALDHTAHIATQYLCYDEGRGVMSFTVRWYGRVGIVFDPSVSASERAYLTAVLPRINSIISMGTGTWLELDAVDSQTLTVYSGPDGLRRARLAGFAIPDGCRGYNYMLQLNGRIVRAAAWFRDDAPNGTKIQELTQALGPTGDHPDGTLWRDGVRGEWLDDREWFALAVLYRELKGNEGADSTYRIVRAVLKRLYGW